MNEVFLNNLFKYYDLTLKIDNILGISLKEKSLSQYGLIDSIEKTYSDALEKNHYFNLDKDIKNDYFPIDIAYGNNLDIFVEKICFLEKATNLDGEKLNKNSSAKEICEHKKFAFSSDNNLFQYGIIYNLIDENPFNKYSNLVPCFVMLFPSYDNNFKLLTPENIFIKIKEYLEIELTPDENKIALDIEITPYLIFNSKLLEPYSLDTPEINTKTYCEVKKEIYTYFNNLPETNILKNKSNVKFLQNEFIIGIPQNLNIGLTKIYNSIFENKNINSLIKSYFNVHKRKEMDFPSITIDENEIISTNKIINSYSNHFGSFDKDYPLAKTQREALSCYLEGKEIVPVNGAPGTGKTSLLRSIFGDYTVKSALETYKNYLDNKNILFTTPIVCSSTNNQALSNVSEGIEKGFSDVIKKYSDTNLYCRWIDDIEITNKKIDFTKTMFVPSIKGKGKTQYELTKSDISSFCNLISQNPTKFINEYFKFRGNQISFDKPNKRTLDDLQDAAKYFFNKINENIKEINSLTKYIKAEVVALEKAEKSIIVKYIQKGIQEDLIKATLNFIRTESIKSNSILNEFEKLQNEYKNIEDLISNHKKEINLKKEEYFDFENIILNKTNKLQSINNKIELEETYLIDFIKSPLYEEVNKLLKIKYNDTFTKEQEKINEDLKNSIFKIRKESNIIDKIAYGILRKGKIKDKIEKLREVATQDIILLDKTFWEQKFFLDDLEETIQKNHNNNIKDLRNNLEILESKISNIICDVNISKIKISQHEESINILENKKRNIELKIDTDFEILSENILEYKDIKELFSYKDLYFNLESLKEKNAELDTKIRTDNFYYALHLLEAMFFIANQNMWNANIISNQFSNKTIMCPVCKKSSISYTEEKETFKCSSSSCNIIYSFNNKFNPKELNKYEVEHIIKNEKSLINGKMYYIKINNKFINIVEEKHSNPDFSFNDIYPIFPLINITCNSFGTIVSNKENNKIQENIFNFMLIDEAGTIPPSKMIILNCAKRVMFFGDTKQLKPVFSYDTKIENRILKDFFEEKSAIDYVARFFSCASKTKNELFLKKNNNAMHIGNSCCSYFLPYNESKMEGDIWLKEHFRCQTPIINISNEISYSNEVIPYKKQHKDRTWENLQFIEHEHEAYNNTNIGEIEEIISFLKNHKQNYINRFLKVLNTKDEIIPEISDEDFYNSIGIITPFSNQEALLKQKIIETFGSVEDESNKQKEPIIKVGTVHKYQGSERETIIFSSVYNKEKIGKTPNLFFNREDPDMINVAVTRAKEIFILFGNKEVLNDENTYSGIMVKHIEKFQKEKIINLT